jgi:quercetin dioxygenase-like cupin family protein
MTGKPRPIPPDDLSRRLTIAQPDEDESLPHIGLVGDTYTILVAGRDTAGKYTLIDMHVPPGGGPPPHRHDFEEMFTVLDGEVLVTFRGQTVTARAGETINVPANAPHSFTNATDTPSRLLCMCAPAGQEKFLRPGRPAGHHSHRSTAAAQPRRTSGFHRTIKKPRLRVQDRTAAPARQRLEGAMISNT